jgi:peptidoglycan/LPS O-acetylase OafA/YrhL
MTSALPHFSSVLGPIPSLDGIRAVAVALVFVAHSGLGNWVPGGLGVTIFFVLSGYLITTLLRAEFAATQGINFRNFYLRRLLRLMPPLLIVVAVSGLLASRSIIDGGFSASGLLATVFYLGNYFLVASDFHGIPAGLGVIWSLAVEEHYYLLYPPLAALLLRAGRIKLSFSLLAVLCAAVLVWRTWLALHGASDAYLTMATDTRIDAILVGCILALVRNPWLDPVPTPNPARDLRIGIACVVVLMGTLFYRNEVFRQTTRLTLQCLAIAPLLYLAVARADHPLLRWLNARPVIYVGTVSYTIYLSHQVVLLGLVRNWPALNGIWLALTGAVVTLLVAEAMRRWIEQPCAQIRKRLHGRTSGRDTAPPLPLAGAP